MSTPQDLARVQVFRARCFGLKAARDADPFDDACTHTMIEECCTQSLVGSFRTMALTGAEIDTSYGSQFYDLQQLRLYDRKMLELGRFCIDPAVRDPDVLRLAWVALTEYVDRHDIGMLIGCSSFSGVNPGPYMDAFALIHQDYLAPPKWAPHARAPEAICFAQDAPHRPSHHSAWQQMPPLLRSYLGMGAWVSDHVVIDRALNTLHVFTGLEIDAIPPKRKALLRAMR
ncbi:MAG: GNAT family N-acetyltransferase [Roseobacter sp.]